MAAPSMEDWFGIQNAFIRYANSLDRCDVDAVVACFSPDASLTSPVLGAFSGHAGVRDFAMRTVRMKMERGVQFRHVVSNLEVDIDGDRAHATCYLLDFMTRDGKTELLSPGVYDCTLRKTDGHWLFERRAVTMDQPFRLDAQANR
jgi:ketosteroid isomerase-like protein